LGEAVYRALVDGTDADAKWGTGQSRKRHSTRIGIYTA